MKSWIWTHFRYDVMSRDCTNLRTTPSLFKRWTCIAKVFAWIFGLLGAILSCSVYLWSAHLLKYGVAQTHPKRNKTSYKYLCIMLHDYGILTCTWYFHVYVYIDKCKAMNMKIYIYIYIYVCTYMVWALWHDWDVTTCVRHLRWL